MNLVLEISLMPKQPPKIVFLMRQNSYRGADIAKFANIPDKIDDIVNIFKMNFSKSTFLKFYLIAFGGERNFTHFGTHISLKGPTSRRVATSAKYRRLYILHCTGCKVFPFFFKNLTPCIFASKLYLC